MRLVMACSNRRDAFLYDVTRDGARIHGGAFGLGGVVRGVWPLPGGGYLACDAYTVYDIAAGGWVERAVSLPAFADLHGVCAGPAPGSFYVASSGADAVLLCDFSSWCRWIWQAGEGGRRTDYRGRGVTSATEHLAHPNSVHPHPEGVLFSVFGPMSEDRVWRAGQIFHTGCGYSLKAGLECPHDARLASDGRLCYVESETGVIVQGDMRYADDLFRWAKCALPLGAGALVGCTDSVLRYVDAGGIRWEAPTDGCPFVMEWLPD